MSRRRAGDFDFHFRLGSEGGALLVLACQLAIAGGLVGMTGIVINGFQSAAANGSFRKAAGACVQCRQALVQAQIAERFRQG